MDYEHFTGKWVGNLTCDGQAWPFTLFCIVSLSSYFVWPFTLFCCHPLFNFVWALLLSSVCLPFFSRLSYGLYSLLSVFLSFTLRVALHLSSVCLPFFISRCGLRLLFCPTSFLQPYCRSWPSYSSYLSDFPMQYHHIRVDPYLTVTLFHGYTTLTPIPSKPGSESVTCPFNLLIHRKGPSRFIQSRPSTEAAPINTHPYLVRSPPFFPLQGLPSRSSFTGPTFRIRTISLRQGPSQIAPTRRTLQLQSRRRNHLYPFNGAPEQVTAFNTACDPANTGATARPKTHTPWEPRGTTHRGPNATNHSRSRPKPRPRPHISNHNPKPRLNQRNTRQQPSPPTPGRHPAKYQGPKHVTIAHK